MQLQMLQAAQGQLQVLLAIEGWVLKAAQVLAAAPLRRWCGQLELGAVVAEHIDHPEHSSQ